MSRLIFQFVKLDFAPNETMSQDLYSEAIEVSSVSLIGLSLSFTGDAVGEFFVQASNDKDTWVNMSFTEGQILANGNGSHALSIKDYPFRYVRIAYIHTSGSSELVANLSMKGAI